MQPGLGDTRPGWDRTCADEAAALIAELTGVDVFAAFGLFSPSSLSEAKALLRAKGVRSVREMMNATFGKPISYRQAKRGDVALLGSAFGVVIGSEAVFFGGHAVPLKHIPEIWAVRHG